MGGGILVVVAVVLLLVLTRQHDGTQAQEALAEWEASQAENARLLEEKSALEARLERAEQVNMSVLNNMALKQQTPGTGDAPV